MKELVALCLLVVMLAILAVAGAGQALGGDLLYYTPVYSPAPVVVVHSGYYGDYYRSYYGRGPAVTIQKNTTNIQINKTTTKVQAPPPPVAPPSKARVQPPRSAAPKPAAPSRPSKPAVPPRRR